MSNAYTSILAFTLFINKLKIEELPAAYMVIAGALLVLNLLYEKLEHRYSPLQLLKYIITGSLLVFFLLWLGLMYGDAHVFIFMLLIWSTLFYMVSGYAFWGLVSLLFNVRESRRVFSVIGAGDIPAKLVGYLSTPLLIGLFGLINLVWFAILTLVIGLYIFHRVIKKEQWDTIRNRSHHEHAEAMHITRKDLLSFFFKNELIFTISLLSILSYNVYLLVDFTFLSQVKHKFENVSSLAFFIAAFFAVGRFIAVILKLVFTSRVIERLGLISCLFITPLILLLMCAGFLLTGGNANLNIYMFGIMAMLTEVLRSAMQEPVFFILFQPLKEKLRLKGHIISKGYMLPFSLITVGGTLYALFRSNVEVTITLTVQILLVNIITWAFIIFLIRKAYIATLHASIRKGIFSSDDIYMYDEITIGILLHKISNGEPSESIYALKLLENAGYDKIDELLQNQLQFGDPVVGLYVLERMVFRNVIDLPTLRNTYDTATNESLKLKIFEVLCGYYPAFLGEQSARSASLEDEYKKTLLIQLLNQEEFSLLRKATREMQQLMASSQPEKRIFALGIISAMRHIRFTHELSSLFNDPDAMVRRQAVLTACRLRAEALLPQVLMMLDDPTQRYLAIKALQLYGDDLFVDWPNPSQKHHGYFITIAGKIKGLNATGFLLKMLQQQASEQGRIIHALWTREFDRPVADQKKTLKALMGRFLEKGLEKMGYYHRVGGGGEHQVIRRALYHEVRNDLLTVLKICSLVYQNREVDRLIELIRSQNRNKIFNAMEMIDVVLPKRVVRSLNQMFDFVIDPLHSRRQANGLSGSRLYSQVLFSEEGRFDAWTRAICMFTLWKHHDLDLVLKLKAEKMPSGSLILEETKGFILKSVN